MHTPAEEIALSGGGRTTVYRRGEIVVRETGPWAPAVHALLRHLEDVGFAGSPRVVGSGFDSTGRETLTYIKGEFTHMGPWTLEGAAAVGRLLRELHEATASYRPPPDALWRPWFGRSLGDTACVIGHCDVGPWNIVARDGLPVALIDWEVDPLVELAQACWLNAKLHSDDVAELEGLPPLADRARQLRAMVDAYGLTAAQRRGFVERIIEFVVYDTAEQADEAGVTRDTTDPTA
nr:aminoglycoside phosphotransferase family protein [Chloroflexota bacterium]